MYVCMYLRTHTRTRARAHTHTHTHTHTYTHTHHGSKDASTGGSCVNPVSLRWSLKEATVRAAEGTPGNVARCHKLMGTVGCRAGLGGELGLVLVLGPRSGLGGEWDLVLTFSRSPPATSSRPHFTGVGGGGFRPPFPPPACTRSLSSETCCSILWATACLIWSGSWLMCVNSLPGTCTPTPAPPSINPNRSRFMCSCDCLYPPSPAPAVPAEFSFPAKGFFAAPPA